MSLCFIKKKNSIKLYNKKHYNLPVAYNKQIIINWVVHEKC